MKKADREQVGLKISMRNRYLLILGLVVAVVAILAYQIQAVFVALVISLTLASAIAPVAEWMEAKLKCPRVISVVLVYVGTILIYSSLAYFLYPTLKEQAQDLIRSFPDYSRGISGHYRDLMSIVQEKAGLDAISQDDVKNVVKGVTSRALAFTSDAITALATGVLVTFLTAAIDE